MVATFDASPMPSQRMNSGSSAIFGIGNSAATAGTPIERGSDQMPIAAPTPRPQTVPSDQPVAMRNSESVTFRQNASERISPASAWPIADRGGSASALTQPARAAVSHNTSSATKNRIAAAQRERSTNPPPRNSTGLICISAIALVSLAHLALGHLRLGLDQLPQGLAQRRQLRLSGSARPLR